MKTECEECLAVFEVSEDAIVGEVVTCPECGSDLEIVEIGNGVAKSRKVQLSGEDWGE
ncbi:MAG: lysine biosynthesis protein LysW [Thermoproteota archaeon]